jgi:hypothetical protein
MPMKRHCNALLLVFRLFGHFVQSPLDPLAFDLEKFHTLKEQIVALPLPRALHPEDEVVSYPAQLDFVLELRMP